MAQKSLILGPIGKCAVGILVDAINNQDVVRGRIAEAVGISEATLSRTLNFDRPPTIDDFNGIAAALGLHGWKVLREAEALFESEGATVVEVDFGRVAAKRDKDGPLDGQGADELP